MSSSKQKIAKVMKQIKEDSEINPNSKWVEFKLNTSFFAPGVLVASEEKRILLKLEKEGIIKLHLPDGGDDAVNALLNQYTPSEFMHKHNLIWVEILDQFYIKYVLYKIFYLKDLKFFYLTNPLWWIWKMTLLFWKFLKLILKHKIISSIIIILSALAGLLALDYTKAWKNLKFIINLIT